MELVGGLMQKHRNKKPAGCNPWAWGSENPLVAYSRCTLAEGLAAKSTAMQRPPQ